MRGIAAPLTKLIIFAVVTVLLTAALASTIGSFGFGNTGTYHAKFTDVTGLEKGDDVRIAGVKVGSVKGIKVVDRNYAEVTFSTLRSTHLMTSARVAVRYRNLVGQRYLDVSAGPGAATPLTSRDVIPLAQTSPALDLTVLFNGFQPLFKALTPKDVNSLSLAIVKTLQGEGGTVDSLLAQTASLTNTLADRDTLIGDVITNLNSVLSTINNRDSELSGLIVQLQRFLSGLSQDRVTIGDSLSSISSLANQTADLVSRGRPALEKDINGLYGVSKSLNDSKSVVNGVLQRLPGKLSALIAVGSSGSWFNFYLCTAGGTVAAPPLTGPVPVTASQVTSAECATS